MSQDGYTTPGTSVRNPISLTDLVDGARIDTELARVKRFSITAAQLIAMFTTPVALFPAPGAGKYIDIISVNVEYKYGTAQYTGGGALQLSYGAGVTTPATATIAGTFLTGPVANQVIKVAGALASALASAVNNVAVNLTNATAVFAAGDGTVDLIVNYRILPIV